MSESEKLWKKIQWLGQFEASWIITFYWETIFLSQLLQTIYTIEQFKNTSKETLISKNKLKAEADGCSAAMPNFWTEFVEGLHYRQGGQVDDFGQQVPQDIKLADSPEN